MDELLQQIRGCTICRTHLPHGCRPVMQADMKSRILIIGQAPGRRVHESGVPWDDASGENLRRWLGVDKATFYNPAKIALMPMGFCYPGAGKSDDLPPRPECAPQWHGLLLEKMPDLKLTLLIGQYAQQYYLGDAVKENLTATVAAFRDYLPGYFPLPHPSPRNNIWMKKNSWFEADVLPALKERINEALND